jgi:hypothetical protein
MMRLATSCRATRHGFLWRQTSGVAEEVAAPQLVQWASRSQGMVPCCRAVATSKSVRHREGRNVIVM